MAPTSLARALPLQALEARNRELEDEVAQLRELRERDGSGDVRELERELAVRAGRRGSLHVCWPDRAQEVQLPPTALSLPCCWITATTHACLCCRT